MRAGVATTCAAVLLGAAVLVGRPSAPAPEEPTASTDERPRRPRVTAVDARSPGLAAPPRVAPSMPVPEAAALEDPEADREARQAQMRAESSADLLALLAGEEDVPADFAELVTTAHEAREQAR